jgi:8-amino-7-oxononanoate synthase
MTKLEEYARNKQRDLAKVGRVRELKETTRNGVNVTQNGKPYISFSCNDYLGLSKHPEVIEAASAAMAEYGVGAGASRLVTGNHPLYTKLEAKIAKMKGTDAALVFGSGYLTNVGIIPALMTTRDIIFADKFVHACLLDGALLSGASFKRFRHNDPKHLEELLVEHRHEYENALILADHVYSMDGDIAPIGHFARLCKDYNAWTLVDDAHGLGMVTPSPKDKVDLWMGTLSKSAGSYGGYIAAKKSVIELLVSRARSLIFSTGLPPSACAAAFAALEIIAEEPQRGARPLELANKVCDALKMQRTGSAIVPIVLGEEQNALDASEALKRRGILAVAIRPPAVPPGTSRLRLTFSADHTDKQVDQLIAALKAEKIKPHV